jgi:hypothetical protein
MKRLLFILVAIVLLVLGSNYYYLHQIKKTLASAVEAARAMGGNLEYKDVNITLGGDVEIHKLRITVPKMEDTLIIERLALKTGGILGVHWLAIDARKDRMPAQLGLSIEGFQLLIGSEFYKQTNPLTRELSESLLLAGCGEQDKISDQTLLKMGYGDFVDVEIQLEYRLMNEGQWLEFETRTLLKDMGTFSSKVDFSLNAKSRDVAALSQVAASARLHDLVIDYKDAGYIKKLFEFCQQESGLAQSEFLNQHMEAWKQALADHGFAAGENLVAAYRQFIEQPDQFGITAKPTEDFGFDRLATITPALLPYQFITDMQVNGLGLGRMDLTLLDMSEQTKKPSRVTTTTDPKRDARGSKKQPVAINALRDHLDQEVVLRLTSGRTLEGRIRETNETGLQLHSYQPGGSMMIPVTFAQIEEAYLK